MFEAGWVPEIFHQGRDYKIEQRACSKLVLNKSLKRKYCVYYTFKPNRLFNVTN